MSEFKQLQWEYSLAKFMDMFFLIERRDNGTHDWRLMYSDKGEIPAYGFWGNEPSRGLAMEACEKAKNELLKRWIA